MRRATAHWALLTALILAAGCAGRDFARPASESLVLGKTTYAEINARMGSPSNQSTSIKNENTLRSILYSYYPGGTDTVVPGITAGRTMEFTFLDQVLVGYQYVSTLKADHTNFDETKVPTIKKGETRRDDVIALLGPPTGMAIYPAIKSKEDVGLVWVYIQVRPLPIRLYYKGLVVSVDPAGVVSDVDFATSGER